MKSKKSISYNTDPITMNNVAIAAKAMRVSVEEIARRAIKEFAGSLEPQQRTCKEGRTKASTVDIFDADTVKILQYVVTQTTLTQSTVVHQCLKKYLENYKPQIKQELEILGRQLNQVAESLVA
jgi:hypothetical protein